MGKTMKIQNYRKNRCIHGKRNGKQCVVTILIVVMLMQISGCSATELEDRCFPMLAVVDYRLGQVQFAYGFPELSNKDATDTEEAKVDAPMTSGADFKEAVSASTLELDKKADCNHMKVFVLSSTFLKQEGVYENMIEYLQQQELFPRNTYVCITSDVKALLEQDEQRSMDIGGYLEELIENHERKGNQKLPTIGNLMDEKDNRRRTLEIPYIEVENLTIVWRTEYVMNKGIPVGVKKSE